MAKTETAPAQINGFEKALKKLENVPINNMLHKCRSSLSSEDLYETTTIMSGLQACIKCKVNHSL